MRISSRIAFVCRVDIGIYFIAKQKGRLDNREHVKVRRKVDNVMEGNFDQQAEDRSFFYSFAYSDTIC